MGKGRTAMVKTTARLLLPLIFAASLAACVSFAGKAPPSMLVLTPVQSITAGTAQTGSAKDALVVLIPQVPRKLETNRVPVQINASNIAYLKDALWADKPAQLMQMLLSETITAKTGRLVLGEVDAGGKATQFLSGSLMEFGLDAASNEAVIVYDAVRLQNGKAIEKKRFEAREAVPEIKAGPAGSALNKAANRVAADVALWLAAAP
jgi:cholesterol transport system auxiliary component